MPGDVWSARVGMKQTRGEYSETYASGLIMNDYDVKLRHMILLLYVIFMCVCLCVWQ